MRCLRHNTRDNRHITRAPQHGHAGGRCGGRNSYQFDTTRDHARNARTPQCSLHSRRTAGPGSQPGAERCGRHRKRRTAPALPGAAACERQQVDVPRGTLAERRGAPLDAPDTNRGHAPLLAPTRADGGRHGIGRPGGTKQTKTQQDKTAYPQTAGPQCPHHSLTPRRDPKPEISASDLIGGGSTRLRGSAHQRHQWQLFEAAASFLCLRSVPLVRGPGLPIAADGAPTVHCGGVRRPAARSCRCSGERLQAHRHTIRQFDARLSGLRLPRGRARMVDLISTDPSVTVVIFCWHICLISKSMGHHNSEIDPARLNSASVQGAIGFSDQASACSQDDGARFCSWRPVPLGCHRVATAASTGPQRLSQGDGIAQIIELPRYFHWVQSQDRSLKVFRGYGDYRGGRSAAPPASGANLRSPAW